MTDRKTGKREAPISYRPPAHLREEFQRRVARSGLSVSSFITQSIFGQEVPRQRRRPALEAKLLAQLLSQGARIQARLDAAASGAADREAVRDAVRELTVIRAALLRAMERKP